jgi:hypothetical protein
MKALRALLIGAGVLAALLAWEAAWHRWGTPANLVAFALIVLGCIWFSER